MLSIYSLDNAISSGVIGQLSGSISGVVDSDQWVGDGTKYTTELSVGDYVFVNNQIVKILSIESDTAFTSIATDVVLGADFSNLTAFKLGSNSVICVSTDFFEYIYLVGQNLNAFITGDYLVRANRIFLNDLQITSDGSLLNLFKIKSANYTAVPGDLIQADTSGAPFTITLPLAPAAGTPVFIEDAALTWDANNLTLDRNGSKINSGTSNYTANAVGGKLSCVYIDATIGWSIK